MPKFAADSIGQRQQVASEDPGQRVTTQVQAHPVMPTVSVGENNLTRLTSALDRYMVPAAQQYFDQREKEQNEEDRLLGFKAEQTGESLNETATDHFKLGYIQSHWQKAATDAGNEAMQEYETRKDDPTFDLNGFLQEKMQTDLNGITNPTALGIYMDHFAKIQAQLQGDFTKHQVDLIHQDRDQNFNSEVSDLVNKWADHNHPQAFTTADDFMAARSELLARYKAQGKTTPEMSESLLEAVKARSLATNGQNAGFDLFFMKQPETGKSLYDMNPKLAQAVEQAMTEADHVHDQWMGKQTFIRNQDTVEGFYDAIRRGDYGAVSDEVLNQHRGQYGALGINGGHPEAIHAIRAARDAAMAGNQEVASALEDFKHHGATKYKPEVQQKYLQQIVGNEINQVFSTIDDPQAFAKDDNGKPVGVANEAMKRIIGAYTESGSNVPNETLKRLYEQVKFMAPDPNSKDASVPTRFANVAEQYKALKSGANPGLVNQYFDDDTRAILDYYNNAVDNRKDPNGAFREAFRSSTPEGRKAADDYVNSPAGKQAIANATAGLFTGLVNSKEGSGYIPNALRTTGIHVLGYEVSRGSYPKNENLLAQDGATEARDFIRSQPWASQSDINSHMENWALTNFIHDKASNMLIKVPPGQSSKDAMEAFGAFTERLESQYGKDAGVSYTYLGNGKYDVRLMNRGDHTVYPQPTFEGIMNAYKYKTHLTPEEDKTWREADTKLRAGTLTQEEAKANAPLFTKASALGLLPDSINQKLQSLQRGPVAPESPITKAINESGVKPGQIDPKVSRIPDIGDKKPVVEALNKQGDIGGVLTALREGVSLRAYNDPARGLNIGIGYNMDQNKATVDSDFRRAGITFPVEDIRSGKATITTEQAIRLYRVVQPKYEQWAKDAYENVAGTGAYDKLAKSEKAVLTDMTYQAGKKVADFKTLIGELAKPEHTITGDMLRMFYKDRNTQKLKEDVNSKNLRLHVLTGRLDVALNGLGYSTTKPITKGTVNGQP